LNNGHEAVKRSENVRDLVRRWAVRRPRQHRATPLAGLHRGADHKRRQLHAVAHREHVVVNLQAVGVGEAGRRSLLEDAAFQVAVRRVEHLVKRGMDFVQLAMRIQVMLLRVRVPGPRHDGRCDLDCVAECAECGQQEQRECARHCLCAAYITQSVSRAATAQRRARARGKM